MAIKPALNQFNGGEISPQLEGRFDWQKYNYSAKLCKNFIPTVEGYLKRRGGSHFVALKKGITESTFKFLVRTESHNDTPTLKLNGEIVTLTNTGGQYFMSDTWETEEYTYKDGDRISYEASATGYITKSGVLTVSDKQQNFTINIVKPSSITATVTFVAPTGTTITLNGTVRNSITDYLGTTVNYSATYQNSTITGSVIIDGDKTYYLVIKDGVLTFGGDNLIMVTTPSEGNIRLPNCRLRIIAVGGGGGALLYGATYFSGGSGGGFDIEIDVTEGLYTWECGSLGVSGTTSSAGVASGLKKGNTIYASAGGGGNGKLSGGYFYGGAGGEVTLKNDSVHKVNWNKKGNACTFTSKTFKGSMVRGASIYNNYGTASGYTTEYTDSYAAGTNGYLYIALAEG